MSARADGMKHASAGMDDRQDTVIHIEPIQVGSGTNLNDIRAGNPTREKEIRGIIRTVLDDLNVEDVLVHVRDRGADDFVLRARLLTVLHRAMEPGPTIDIPPVSPAPHITDDRVPDEEPQPDPFATKDPRSATSPPLKKGYRLKLRRSRIYIPGNRPRMILKAPSFGADAVILDLEDSVPPEEKDSARFLVASALEHVDFGSAERMVRINPLDVCGVEDLESILLFAPDAIVLPKCESPDQIRKVVDLMKVNCPTANVDILPLIETARGVLSAYEIASASDRVTALTFGGEDFTRDIGAERTREGTEILLARSMLVMAAKAAGIQALDTVFTDVKDHEGLRRDAEAMRRLGFDGKGAIHPSQVGIIHDVYTPSLDDLRHAAKVVRAAAEAKERGSGIAVLNGKMIDMPVIQRAEKVLFIARLLGLTVPSD